MKIKSSWKVGRYGFNLGTSLSITGSGKEGFQNFSCSGSIPLANS